MAYDVANYTPGDGHQSFTAEGPVEGAGAAPAPAPAAEVKPEVKVEVKPDASKAEPELQEQEAPPESTGEPVALQVPSFVDAREITEERQGWVNEFARIAPEAGLSTETAQGLMDLVVDCAVTLPYSAPDQYTTAEDAKSAMIQLYGDKIAGDLIARCQKYTSGSEALRDYLDRTGLGQDVGVITALALAGAGWIKLTPTQAEGAAKRLMADKSFADPQHPQHALTMVKLQMLARLSNRAAVDPLAEAVKPKAAPVTGPGVRHQQQVTGVQAARQELAELAGKRSLTTEERARWATLVAQVSR